METREADYILEIDGERILVKAEPLNKNLLNDKEHEVDPSSPLTTRVHILWTI